MQYGKHSKTEIGRLIGARLDELNLSIYEAARKVGCTYESVRQIIGGATAPVKYQTIPDDLAIRAMWAPVLGLDAETLIQIARRDRLQRARAKVGLEGDPTMPEAIKTIVEHWSNLSDEHKNDLVTLVEVWATEKV